MRSRSTSQNFSDEIRRLCAGSTWIDSSSSIISRRGGLEFLFDFCSLRLDLDVLERGLLSRPALFNDSPFLVSPFLFTFGSCHNITPVVTDLLR
jgi:hypothetical protein